MSFFAGGAAFIDGAGTVLAADPGFAASLGLAPGDPSAALEARAGESPALRALLAGKGPSAARLAGRDGEPVEVERVPAAGGALLLVRLPDGEEWAGHAVRSLGLAPIAAGLAHDVKNPLNAMALQLALLGDGSIGAAGGGAPAGRVGALREQIARVSEVVRRFQDVLDPSAPFGQADVGGLAADSAGLLGHEARRRQIELTVEAPRGAVGASGDPARVARLLLGLLAEVLAATADGGRFAVRAERGGDEAVVRIEHAPAKAAPGWRRAAEVMAGAARALGGALAIEQAGEAERVTVRLPGRERS